MPVEPNVEYPVLRQGLGESPRQYLFGEEEEENVPFSMDDIPEKLRPAVLRIREKLEPVCKSRLTDEYLELGLCLLRDACLAGAEVGRKPEAWAAGLGHAIGRVNFLFDPAMKPHLSAKEIPELFFVSKGTSLTRCNQLCDEFDLGPWSVRFMTEEMRQKTPFTLGDRSVWG